jgi:hypothetical protein
MLGGVPRPTRCRVAPAGMPLVVTVALALAVGCGGDDGPDAGRFCDEIRADTAAVVSPPLATPQDVEAAIDNYRRLGELAPAGVADDWDALVTNLETAATVVPDDPDSVQRAVAQAYATEQSAVAVGTWLRDRCAIDLGPITTIVPQGRPAPATAPPATDGSATTVVLGTEPAG